MSEDAMAQWHRPQKSLLLRGGAQVQASAAMKGPKSTRIVIEEYDLKHKNGAEVDVLPDVVANHAGP